MLKVPGSVVKVVEHGGKTYNIQGSNYARAIHFSFPKNAVGPVGKIMLFSPPKSKLVSLSDFVEPAHWAGDYDGAITIEDVIVLIKRVHNNRVVIHYAVEQTVDGEFAVLSKEAKKITARIQRDLKSLESVAGKMERIVGRLEEALSKHRCRGGTI